MLRRIIAALALLAFIATSCGSDETSTDDTAQASTDDASSTDADDDPADDPETTTTTEAPDFDGDDDSDFCTMAREFAENDPLADSSILEGAAFFDRVEALWGEVIPAAPDEIRGDFEATLASFQEMRAILEPDYNFLDPEVAAGLDAMDTTASEAADARISAYLEDVCGVVREVNVPDPDAAIPLPDPDDLEALEDNPEAIENILEAFGITPELAECLEAELGDDFDFENPDPALFTQEICGTTLLEIFTNIGSG